MPFKEILTKLKRLAKYLTGIEIERARRTRYTRKMNEKPTPDEMIHLVLQKPLAGDYGSAILFIKQKGIKNWWDSSSDTDIRELVFYLNGMSAEDNNMLSKLLTEEVADGYEYKIEDAYWGDPLLEGLRKSFNMKKTLSGLEMKLDSEMRRIQFIPAEVEKLPFEPTESQKSLLPAIFKNINQQLASIRASRKIMDTTIEELAMHRLEGASGIEKDRDEFILKHLSKTSGRSLEEIERAGQFINNLLLFRFEDFTTVKEFHVFINAMLIELEHFYNEVLTMMETTHNIASIFLKHDPGNLDLKCYEAISLQMATTLRPTRALFDLENLRGEIYKGSPQHENH